MAERPAKRVRFHKARAVAWLLIGAIVGIVAWKLPDQRTVILLVATTACSFYANFSGDWGAGEAADDKAVTERLDRIEALLRDDNAPT